jgi:MerR family transcriptional regulator, light-induced transcriptional regulator
VADEALTAGAVARRLGVAVTTLRTWHQRYGLGPSHHVPGQHRRYTAEDLARLQVMRRLTGQGVAPAEAAAWAQRIPIPIDLAKPLPAAPVVLVQDPEPPLAPSEDLPSLVDQDDAVLDGTYDTWPERLFTARDGGGHNLRTGRAGPAARGLARAAMRLDAPALRDILEMIVTDRGVVAAWEDVIMPVLIGIGERYAATKRFIEVEHLISRGITEVLGTVSRPTGLESPRVLLAAADEEQHTLPLEALAAALAQAGVPSRLLGARMPPEALRDAITRTGPTAVVLWSQLPSTGDPDQWAIVLSGPHRPLLAAAAGPGWSMDDLPEGITPLGSLTEAVRLVALAVTPHPRRSEP